jgi:hypothetical protein
MRSLEGAIGTFFTVELPWKIIRLFLFMPLSPLY